MLLLTLFQTTASHTFTLKDKDDGAVVRGCEFMVRKEVNATVCASKTRMPAPGSGCSFELDSHFSFDARAPCEGTQGAFTHIVIVQLTFR